MKKARFDVIYESRLNEATVDGVAKGVGNVVNSPLNLNKTLGGLRNSFMAGARGESSVSNKDANKSKTLKDGKTVDILVFDPNNPEQSEKSVIGDIYVTDLNKGLYKIIFKAKTNILGKEKNAGNIIETEKIAEQYYYVKKKDGGLIGIVKQVSLKEDDQGKQFKTDFDLGNHKTGSNVFGKDFKVIPWPTSNGKNTDGTKQTTKEITIFGLDDETKEWTEKTSTIKDVSVRDKEKNPMNQRKSPYSPKKATQKVIE